MKSQYIEAADIHQRPTALTARSRRKQLVIAIQATVLSLGSTVINAQQTDQGSGLRLEEIVVSARDRKSVV